MLSRLGHRPVLDVAIPGLYAWGVTVAWPLLDEGNTRWAYTFGILSLVALGSAGMLVTSRRRIWSAVSVGVFVAASALVWFVVGAEARSLGWIGSVGWAAFAIGWVRASGTRQPEDMPPATTLELTPRRAPSKTSIAMLALGIGCATVPWLFAWNVEGRERALLAHGLAILGSLHLLSTASDLSASIGQKAERTYSAWSMVARTMVYGGLMALGCWLTFA